MNVSNKISFRQNIKKKTNISTTINAETFISASICAFLSRLREIIFDAFLYINLSWLILSVIWCNFLEVLFLSISLLLLLWSMKIFKNRISCLDGTSQTKSLAGSMPVSRKVCQKRRDLKRFKLNGTHLCRNPEGNYNSSFVLMTISLN